MSDSGPTTAGSIRGVLTLNTSDWDEKIKRAELAAKNLARQNPTISIDVDDNGAISKMAAVDAAAKALSGSEQDLTRSTRDASAANGSYASRWQIIAGLIATAVPLIAPLSTAVVGLAGGLLGLGAAAGIGIYGVIQAMKQGTAVGDAYSTGLKQLKSDLDALGNTAATTLLNSFQRGVELINKSLPQLNSEIGQFSSILGRAGVNALQGVLNLLRDLNPLFVTGAQYVGQLAAGFEKWTTSGGLQQFVQYAEREMPKVMDMLGNLVGAVTNIVIALAPLGDAAVTVLGGMADIIARIPVPVLTATAGAALAIWAAFKLGNGVGSIIDNATAAVGRLKVASVGASAAATDLAASEDSVAASTSKVGASIGSWLGWAGIAVGAAVAIDQLNTSVANTALSMTPLGEEIDRVNAAVSSGDLAKGASDYKKLSAGMDAVSHSQSLVLQGNVAVAKWLHSIGADWVTLGADTAIAKQVDAINSYKSAMSSAGDSVKGTTYSVQDLKTAEDNAKTATDKFAQALRGLGDVNLSADQANIQFQQSLADSSAAIAKNGKTLDENTQAGRDNMSALDSVASSALGLVSAQAKQGASETALQGTMATSRAAFIKSAEAAGLTASQAENLANKYHLIPKEVSVKYKSSGAQAAIDNARRVAAALGAVQRNIVVTYSSQGSTVQMSTQGNAARRGTSAGGPIRKGMAEGGVAGRISGPGNAFNDMAGLFPLADGEFVVSDRFKQASQYMRTLMKMNAGAPGSVIAAQAMQDAGVRFGSRPTVHQHTHNYYFNVAANDPNELMQKVSLRQNRMGAV